MFETTTIMTNVYIRKIYSDGFVPSVKMKYIDA